MQTWLPGGDRARIEAVVHDYVLEHPELIPQAIQRLQDRETGRVIAANKAAILTPVASAWMGNPQGHVTVAEYFDYNCGFCRASLPTTPAPARKSVASGKCVSVREDRGGRGRTKK